jgi:hypothetical protein
MSYGWFPNLERTVAMHVKISKLATLVPKAFMHHCPLDKHRAVDVFRREPQPLATLDHGNLPKVSEYFSEGDKHYLVMGVIQGLMLESVTSLSRQYNWR